MSKPKKRDGAVYARSDGKVLWIRYWDRNGKPRRESTHTTDWDEANRKLRERLQARDGNLLEVIRKGEALNFGEWADSFLKSYSKPPIRAAKTHEANMRCIVHLKAAFGDRKLVDLTADAIEHYLRDRLEQRVRVKFNGGYREKGPLKSSTVHQEFRVLRRMLNVAVRKKLLAANPCSGVEFPVTVKGLFRPHYVTWSEQERIESHGPEYLRNVVRTITETGLRVYKELVPMRKDQVDLSNAVVGACQRL
jgi:site-specific recombinase XerD